MRGVFIQLQLHSGSYFLPIFALGANELYYVRAANLLAAAFLHSIFEHSFLSPSIPFNPSPSPLTVNHLPPSRSTFTLQRIIRPEQASRHCRIYQSLALYQGP
jgi:hypothetical protein